MSRKACVETFDLFAAMAPAPVIKAERRKRNAGLDRGRAMAELAAARAGEAWKESAYQAFVAHAKKHKLFTTDEVRAARPDLPDPPDRRAWGHIAMRAKRLGVVETARLIHSKNSVVHGAVVTQWRAI